MILRPIRTCAVATLTSTISTKLEKLSVMLMLMMMVMLGEMTMMNLPLGAVRVVAAMAAGAVVVGAAATAVVRRLRRRGNRRAFTETLRMAYRTAANTTTSHTHTQG